MMAATEDGPSYWSVSSQNQWIGNDDPDVRHLLVKKGTTYKELQGRYVHTYTGPAAVAEIAWPLGNPNTMDSDNPPCRWVSTVELSAEPSGTVQQVLTYLLSLVP
jgi:hypothetical protein